MSIGYFLQVILLRVLARYLSGWNKFSNVRRFSILQSGEGSTSSRTRRPSRPRI